MQKMGIKNLNIWLLYAVIATVLLAPLASNNTIPNTLDLFNHIASIVQAKMGLEQGQFPLRIAPLEQSGWQYPLYQFYAPTSYTLAGLIYAWLTPSNPYIAYKICLWCSLLIGGIYMYRLANWLVKDQAAAILAGVVFLCSPYMIIIINHISAFNEVIALNLVPAVLYYTLKQFYSPRNLIFFMQTTFTWYLIATIHLITFFYTSLFIALLLIYFTYKQSALFLNLIKVGFTYTFACFLAAWYLLPILMISKYLLIGKDTTLNFTQQSLSDLLTLFARYSLPPQKNYDLAATIKPAIGWPIIFAACFCFYKVITNSISRRKNEPWVCFALILFFTTVSLILAPPAIWLKLPFILSFVQYSWRLLTEITWLGALLFAWTIHQLFRNQLRIIPIIFSSVLIFACSSTWLPITQLPYSPLSLVTNSPMLIFNPNAYIIPALRKNQPIINLIDNILLNNFIKNNSLDATPPHLILNTPLLVERDLLNLTPAPYISLEVNIQKNYPQQKLLTVINNTPVAALPLKSGTYNWKVPLSSSNQKGQQNDLRLQFKTTTSKPLIIPVKDLILTGFLDPNKIISPNQIQSHCNRSNGTTCSIYVPNNVRLVELPVLYYPQLINVTLNSQPIPLLSVLYRDFLIAGILPKPGIINTIQVTFTGLRWANDLSHAAWLMWGVLFIIALLQAYRRKRAIQSISRRKR